MRRLASFATLLPAAAIMLTAPVAATTQLAIKIGDTQVVATGMTPAGRVAWFAFARERTGWVTQVLHWEDLTASADTSGQAILDLGRPVPVKAIFIAVDVSTGAYVASSPEAYPWATQVPFPTAGIELAADRASVVSLRDDHDELEVLVVRPLVGAWRATAHHNDPQATEAPGVLVNFADLTPWGDAPPTPGPLRTGDLVVAIDPEQMQYFAQQLSGRY
jgi:hypothetical protein